MTLVLNALAAPRLWVALTETGGAYGEAGALLQQELAGRFDVSLAPWTTLFARQDEVPQLIVTVGVAALDGVLEALPQRGPAWQRIPLLAVMVPQAIFAARRAVGPVLQQRAYSAVVLDQPLARQLALIRRALPQTQRVGVLAGPLTRPFVHDLKQAARPLGMTVHPSPAIDAVEDIYPALQQTLEATDVILALPDPLIYNPGSLQNILLTTYRARKPLVAYSPAYVRAGAILAVYSTPAQVARSAAEMLRHWQPGRGLPPPQSPREFEVAMNARVTASLGLPVDPAAQIATDLRQLEQPQ